MVGVATYAAGASRILRYWETSQPTGDPVEREIELPVLVRTEGQDVVRLPNGQALALPR